MGKSVPWKLQISLRTDCLQTLLEKLSHSSILTLAGASLKPHQAQLGRQALELQQMMGFRSSKGE